SYRNSDFFYAKFVIIVESKVDAEVVKYLLKRDDINLEVYGVSIVNLDGVRNLKYPLFLIQILKIPYLVIVDKDLFLPYLNDELKQSRDSQGLPKYRYEFKDNSLIQELVPNTKNRTQLLKLFRTNHSKALNLLENYNIVCMKHSLEIDLIGSCIAEEEFYNHLSVPEKQRNKTELLVNRYKQIKRLDNIIPILSRMENKNLPHSYKRIKKIVSTFIKKM
ncbi:MAG: TOPRIM nucleotidyl transferase/hydrolase domain-containing protein, partial [Waterburya sp.]